MAIKQASMNPAKIPKPPKEGIGLRCIFLSSGISNNFFCSAMVMIAGIARKVIANEIAIENNTSNISQILSLGISIHATNRAGWAHSVTKALANYSVFSDFQLLRPLVYDGWGRKT